ncbi:hypothetical protein LX36DRAFT_660910 [Colletotrichum falcatum]|nr:hypothetical protein LX36DRAFT_660910 [Colletotrichum falcatum]
MQAFFLGQALPPPFGPLPLPGARLSPAKATHCFNANCVTWQRREKKDSSSVVAIVFRALKPGGMRSFTNKATWVLTTMRNGGKVWFL